MVGQNKPMTMARNDPAYPLRFPSEQYRDRLKEEAKAQGLSLQEYIIDLIDRHPHRAFDLERMPHGQPGLEYFWSRRLREMVARWEDGGIIYWDRVTPNEDVNAIDGDDGDAFEREYQARFVATP